MNAVASPWLGEVTLAQGPVELTKAPEAWTMGDLTAWLSNAMPQLQVRPDCAAELPEGFLQGLRDRTFQGPGFPIPLPAFFPANISTAEGDYIRELHACFFIQPVLDQITDELVQDTQDPTTAPGTPLPQADPESGIGNDLLLIGGLGAGAILLAVGLQALGV